MSDELKAIDLILKMLPFLKDLTGVRRREFFDKRITPLFKDLEDAQDFYNSAFLEARDQFVKIKVKNSSFLDHTSVISNEGALKELQEVKETLIRRRKTDEAVRDSLRYEAKDIFQEIQWKEEKRFVNLVACYFLERGGVSPDQDWLDRDIESVVSSDGGGRTKWDTPARSLYKALRETNDMDELIRLVDDARNKLNQLFMNARRSYKSVQSAIIKNT